MASQRMVQLPFESFVGGHKTMLHRARAERRFQYIGCKIDEQWLHPEKSNSLRGARIGDWGRAEIRLDLLATDSGRRARCGT